MNRALLALACFAALVAAGLAWIRATLPAPELLARPETFPATAAAYLEVRDVASWLAAGGLSSLPGLRAELGSMSLDGLAVALVPGEAARPGVTALAVAESPDPSRVAVRLEAAILSRGYEARRHRQGPASWTTFTAEDRPALALYAGRHTVALALGAGLLESRLVGRHTGPSLGGDAAFAAARARAAPGRMSWLRPGFTPAAARALDRFRARGGPQAAALAAEVARELGLAPAGP